MLELIKKPGNTISAFSPGTVSNSKTEFSYDPEESKTFVAYFRRYEEIFREDCKSWTNEERVRLLLNKLALAEHEKYRNFILSKITSEICFQETVELQ